jgi:D-glycero-alpha-D-manno-heptose-7-phosphate kinase
MLLFYTGRQRTAASVLEAQKAAIEGDTGDTVATLARMRDLAYVLRDRLAEGDVAAVGDLLHDNWELKRSLTAGISNPQIDDYYERARAAGATGGKLLGAGSSGFLLVLAAEDRHAAVRRALGELREVPFRFSARGTHIQLFEPGRED